MSFADAGFGVISNQFLDFVPGLHIYGWFAVVFDDEVTEFEDADEDLV